MTDDDIVTADADICSFEQESVTVIYYDQQLCTKTVRCSSIHNWKSLKGLFAKVVHRSICWTPR